MAHMNTTSKALHSVRINASPMESRLTSKGQATIPKAIRDHLGLKPGDRVKFFRHPNGSVVMLSMQPVSALRGMLARPGQPALTLEDMDAGIGEAVAERDRRSRER
jgi:AbrB family looped-hinge helix DNA binding protein